MYLLPSACPLIEDLFNTDFLAVFTSAEVFVCVVEIVGAVLSVEAPTLMLSMSPAVITDLIVAPFLRVNGSR